VTAGPALANGLLLLALDGASRTLYGKSFCCPIKVFRVATATGAETQVGTSDLGSFGGNSLAVDPLSHTIYAVREELTAFAFNQYVVGIDEQSGNFASSPAIPLTGYLRSLVVEAPLPTITPDSIISDVNSAQASGAIGNAGVAASLLAELTQAKAARTRGDCTTAANIYQAFVNDVTAQTGKAVAPATAAQLIAEARFLIANCP
jgi:hypothetical protein